MIDFLGGEGAPIQTLVCMCLKEFRDSELGPITWAKFLNMTHKQGKIFHKNHDKVMLHTICAAIFNSVKIYSD